MVPCLIDRLLRPDTLDTPDRLISRDTGRLMNVSVILMVEDITLTEARISSLAYKLCQIDPQM